MHLAVDLRRAVPAPTAIRDTLAADEQLSCIGVPGTPAGVADPGLSASVLIGGCVALSAIGMKYQIDPIKDLRPVCPNCHSVIHRDASPLSIEQARALLSPSKR